MKGTRTALLARLTLLGLVLVSTAHASEDTNPFQPVLPPSPPYPSDARLLLPDIPEYGVMLEMPDPLRIVYRRAEFPLVPSSLELWIDGVEYTERLEFWGDHATLDLSSRSSWSLGSHTVLARILDENGVMFEAIDDIVIVGNPCPPSGCPWPFDDTSEPSVVSNIMEDWQDFGGTTDYWHSGIDIRADAGTPIKACTAGAVVKVVNYRPTHEYSHLYWEVAVEDSEGFVWQYHHLDPVSITVIEGQNVLQGQVLGEVVAWGLEMHDHEYNHLHLNVARWVGGGPVPGPYVDGFLYYNPLNFLTTGTYADTVLPVDWDIYYSVNESNDYFDSDLELGTPVLSGEIDVIARLADRMTTIPPAQGQPYDLGIYQLAFEAIPVDTDCDAGYLPKQQLAKFDMVPGGSVIANQEDMLYTIYKDVVGNGHDTHFDYQQQHYYYTLTNVHDGYPDGPNGFWDTDWNSLILGPRHPDGDYHVKIYATDWYGNESVVSASVELDNGLSYAGLCPGDIGGFQWDDPIEIHSLAMEVWTHTPQPVALSFSPLSRGSATALVDETQWAPWEFELPSRGLVVKVAPASGAEVEVEYIPYLGDVILEIPAEVDVCVLSSGQLLSTQPVHLRLSTRLARNPWSGEAHIGTPDPAWIGEFELVMAEAIDVLGEPMLLRTSSGGTKIVWLDATSVEEGPTPTPRRGVQLDAFPNPFNPQVVISLQIERDTRLQVDVFDSAGRRVRRLHAGSVPSGTSRYTWNGTDAHGERLSSGVYFVRAFGEGVDQAIKIALIQ